MLFCTVVLSGACAELVIQSRSSFSLIPKLNDAGNIASLTSGWGKEVWPRFACILLSCVDSGPYKGRWRVQAPYELLNGSVLQNLESEHAVVSDMWYLRRNASQLEQVRFVA